MITPRPLADFITSSLPKHYNIVPVSMPKSFIRRATFSDRYRIYRFVGYTGSHIMSTGVIYAPYVPILIVP